MASSDKLERLLNLTAALLETTRPLTAEEIAQRVFGYPREKGAFRRAFERDKEALRAMGIPIELQDVPATDPPAQGYRIPKERSYIRDPGLEADELAALQLAASAVRLQGVESTAGLWKLGGTPAGDAADATPVAAIPSDERLVALFGALTARCPVTFTYRTEQRTIDPYRLDFQRGHWYVTGYDHARADARVFRVDRIDPDAGVTAGRPASFAAPDVAVPGALVEPWQLGEGEPVRGRVLVDAEQAAMAVAVTGADTVVEERADGAVVIELPVTNPEGFRAFVLGFLDHAEVLGPPELRADMVAWLRALAEQPA